MISDGDGLRTDRRAVTNVVGVVLLIGLVLAGALLVVTFGGDAISETEQRSRMQVAEQSVREVSDRLEKLSRGSEQSVTSFELPSDVEGEINVARTTSMKITTITSDGNHDCTTGPIPMGTINYEHPSGDTVAYEGGGVWRKYPTSGTVMVSPPELNYRNGRIAMQMANVSGPLGKSDRIVAKVDETMSNQRNSNISLALATDYTVKELQSGAVSIDSLDDDDYVCAGRGTADGASNQPIVKRADVAIVNSQYAPAWHRYALDNFDEKRVSVSPPAGSSVEPGGTVTISFKLGDTEDPRFIIDNMTGPTGVREGDSPPVKFNVSNVGGLDGSTNVELTLEEGEDPDGDDEMEGWTAPSSGSATYSVNTGTLGPSDTTEGTITLDSAALQAGKKYRYTVDTGDETSSGMFWVGSSSDLPPNFQLDVDSPETANLGEPETVEVTVENTGDIQDTQTVEFRFDWVDESDESEGVVLVNDKERTLVGGEDDTFTFDIPTDDEGANIPIKIATEDDTVEKEIDIGGNPTFVVDENNSPNSVSLGDQILLDATIKNTGDVVGEQTVEITMAGDTEPKTMELEGSHSESGPETGTITHSVPTGSGESIDSTGLHSYTIETENQTLTGTVQVGQSANPLFQVTTTDVSPTTVKQNETVTLNTTIDNVGESSGTQTIEFSLTGPGYAGSHLLTTETKTLDKDDSYETELTEEIASDLDPGTYEFTVSTENQTAGTEFEVLENESNRAITNFSIIQDSAPTKAQLGEQFEINATIVNIGDEGSQTVRLSLFNSSDTDDVVDVLDPSVTLSTGEEHHLNLTIGDDSGELQSEGRYTYRVETQNESDTGNTYVGSSADANFQVSDIETTPDRVEKGGTIRLDALVNNVGDGAGTQDVGFAIDSDSLDDPIVVSNRSVSIDPDGSWQPARLPSYTFDGGESGQFTYIVETDNSTLTDTFYVGSGIDLSDGSGDGSSVITVNENITARLTVLGTSLTGLDWGDRELIRTPITASIFTENESAGEVRNYVWGESTDLNTPSMRQRQLDNDPFLNRTIRVGAGTSLSVFATSWHCNWWQWKDSGIDRSIIFPDSYHYLYRSGPEAHSFSSLACSEIDPDNKWIEINSDQNTNNVVALGDGDDVPAYDAAQPDQRSVQDVLGDKVDSSGTLDLESDQAVFMYELSERGADPDDADGFGDPDYNDAIVLFEVVNHTETRQVQSPANLAITGDKAPTEVIQGEDADFAINVTNFGDLVGNDTVSFTFESESFTETGDIEGKDSKWINYSIDTSVPEGLYTLTAELQDSNDTVSRNIYVKDRPKPYFLPAKGDYDRTVSPGDSITIGGEIQNIGEGVGTQEVTATVVEGTDITATNQQSWPGSPVTLGPGEGSSADMAFATNDGRTGTVTIQLQTDNASVSYDVTVENNENKLQIVDSSAPASVTHGDDPEYSLTVENMGPNTAESDVEFRLENSSETVNLKRQVTGEVDSGAQEGLTFSFSTDPSDVSEGTYTLAAQLEETGQWENRSVYVEERAKPYFLPTKGDFDDTVESGTSIDLDPRIENTGDAEGEQDITVKVTNDPDGVIDGDTEKSWDDLELDPSDQASRAFTFDTKSDKTGTVDIQVSTENATATYEIQVAEGEFEVKHLSIGDSEFADGETIPVVSGELDGLTARIRNVGGIEATREVKLEIDGNSPSEDVTLAGEESENVRFDVSSHDWTSSAGSYDYTVTAGDATFEGTIEVFPEGEAPDDAVRGSSDLISINMNQITIGS